MKNVIKIVIGTALTIIFTTFVLSIINASGNKNYTTEDIPGIGWTIKVTKEAGKALGEKMRKPKTPTSAGESN